MFVGVAAVLIAVVVLEVYDADVDDVAELDTAIEMVADDAELVVGCIDGMPG